RVLVRMVPLHRDLDRALVALALEVDDALVDWILRRVDVRDEVADPALVVELDRLAAGALVGEDDAQPAREKCRLAEPLRQRFRGELALFEDLRARKDRDRRSRVVLTTCRAADRPVARRHPPRAPRLVALPPAAAPRARPTRA